MLRAKRARAPAATLAFLLLLIFLGVAPTWLDVWLVILVWGAFLAGSVIVVVKSIRDGQIISGQLGALPQSWRRWILDWCDTPPNPDNRRGS